MNFVVENCDKIWTVTGWQFDLKISWVVQCYGRPSRGPGAGPPGRRRIYEKLQKILKKTAENALF